MVLIGLSDQTKSLVKHPRYRHGEINCACCWLHETWHLELHDVNAVISHGVL